MKRSRGIFSGAAAVVLVFLCLAPFAFVLLRSFLTGHGVDLRSYYDVFLGSPQYLFRFWKSLGMCGCIAAGQLAVSVLAGWGFAKYRFKGRDTLFFLLMLLMVLPVQVTLVPDYILLHDLGLLDTYAALILPSIFLPLGAFILTQSFQAVPDAIVDSAMLDGCGIFRMLMWVVLPMSKSGLVCTVLLSFLDGWNMVEQPIAYLKDFDQYPLSVALAYRPPADATIQLVCCILVVLPALSLFTFFNRELVEGIVLAEVK